MTKRESAACTPARRSHGTRLACLARSAVISSAVATALAQAQEPAIPAAPESLQEVVVTANRRAQSLNDVPYNISAIGADAIAKSGATSLADLARLSAGLVEVDQGPALFGSGNNIIMRGLNAQSLNRTADGQEVTVSPVSTYLGNIPIFFPVTIKDLERVEVLRGPQGTLYGSGSAGGTVRFIPKSPELNKTSFEVNASGGYTQDASQPNGSVDGVINLPIGEHIAIRTVAGYERLAGFIDQVGLIKTSDGSARGIPTPAIPGDLTSSFLLSPEKDTNNSDDYFVRADLKWQPIDTAKVDFIYHHQNTHVQDLQSINPYWPGGVVDFSLTNFPGSRGPDELGLPNGGFFPNGSTLFPGGGRYRDTKFFKTPNARKVDVFAVDGSVDLGFATLSSTTSYFHNTVEYLTENSPAYDYVNSVDGGIPLVAFYNFFPRLTVPTWSDRDNKNLSEEIRLASNGEHRMLDYVVGAYYSDERTHDLLNQYNPGITEFSAATTQFHANPQYGDLNWYTDRHIRFKDRALFGELTWHIMARWQVTGGVRFFWQQFANDYRQQFYICGAFCGDGVSPNQELGTSVISQDQSTHDHISKLNTSFDITHDMKLYFTYAEGFRRGGPNGLSTVGNFASLPQYLSFKPDLAKNYEIGVKGTFAGRLNYTLSAFNINWTNFQFEGGTPSAIPAVFNGDRAQSRGLEAELTALVSRQLSLSLGYAYTDAKLTSTFQLFDYKQYGFLAGDAPILAISGPKGAPLPGASKNSITASADYMMPISADGETALEFNINGSYRSAAAASFPSASIWPSQIPSQVILNTRVALDLGPSWSVDLSVRNLTNALGLATGSPRDHAGPFTDAVVTRPRTVTMGIHFRK